MEVKASARFIRVSPRKVRLVIDVVRGLPVTEALTQLQFMNKAAAEPVYKAVSSALANAENNFKQSRENLYIKTITADGGPSFYRFRPRAFGRAAPIRKRTTHLQVVLDEKLAKAAVSTKKSATDKDQSATVEPAVKKVVKKTVKKTKAK